MKGWRSKYALDGDKDELTWFRETVRVTSNHAKFLTWTLGVNKALVSIGETLLRLDAEVKKLGAQKAETRSLVAEMQEE